MARVSSSLCKYLKRMLEDRETHDLVLLYSVLKPLLKKKGLDELFMEAGVSRLYVSSCEDWSELVLSIAKYVG